MFNNVVQGIQDSQVLVLNFDEADRLNLPPIENIHDHYLSATTLDPLCADERQKFNERLLEASGKRYLIGRYLEDRGDMLFGSDAPHAGRMIHMGVDLFCAGLESVFCPADGVVIDIDFEAGEKAFGNSILIRHESEFYSNRHAWYSFYGHLGSEIPVKREDVVAAGQHIGNVGDVSENGGWSRHLHFQICSRKPTTIVGYVSRKDLALASIMYPNPYAVLNLTHLMTDAI